MDFGTDVAALPARRTKLVFLYSSDDEDDDKGTVASTAMGTPMMGEVCGVLHNGNGCSGSIAVEVEEEACLRPPAEDLMVMRQEADALKQKEEKENPDFVEDVEGVAEVPTRPRVKVVDAPALWETAAGLRNYLRAEEVGTLSNSHKRFREEEKDELNACATGVERRPQPLFDDDGLVRAVAVDGYTLTVDETELQQMCGSEGMRERCAEDRELHDYLDCDERCELGGEDADEGREEEEGEYGDDEEDEDDEEEDEELDAALVVAVVEQLVRCCESDELDEALRGDGDQFLERARPLLHQVNSGEMEPLAFGEEVRKDILKLQRAFRRVSRPRDEPVVIDGVVMDI
ncbi:hypothetical protein DPX39_110094900 [Trypanosoma brucei equiperdum]|uniref:Uncharacterized protein n=1 Tax=Trypanosoma brucei equiperdum TaxID=630700 RepID=A0A3L6KWS0_9TRYP|nr:hypothetical protein DPX39_110094900 [Trypanosoma brucei equiperdum]